MEGTFRVYMNDSFEEIVMAKVSMLCPEISYASPSLDQVSNMLALPWYHPASTRQCQRMILGAAQLLGICSGDT
jgi:hypothetical protein